MTDPEITQEDIDCANQAIDLFNADEGNGPGYVVLAAALARQAAIAQQIEKDAKLAEEWDDAKWAKDIADAIRRGLS